ncbi:MAG TPA: class I tRNA ligase family protein [Jatrophihabitans sp.]|nr:class I tRNA ligase family protein [Jatrophihabitans sp.]
MSELTDVFVIAPPTTNGPLHIGHMSGPFIAADVASRASRAAGTRTWTLGGIDVHPNWVLTRAENEGIDVGKLVDEFVGRIDVALDLARVECDSYLDARQPEHQQLVARLAAQLADTVAHWSEQTLYRCADCERTLHNSYLIGICSRCGSGSNGGTCEGCGGYASAADLIEARCNRCGGAPEPFQARLPMLRLADLHDELELFWMRADYPRRIRDLIAGYLAGGLPEIPLGYPTNWGVPGTGSMAGLTVDVNVELGLGTYLLAARGVDPQAGEVAELQQAWRGIGRLWWFHGIDNGFYFALLWPALFAALGVQPGQVGGAAVNEFYTLDGQKFSTSRNHAIWADEELASEDPALIRLYLSWDRPDRYCSDYTRDRYLGFRDRFAPVLSGQSRMQALPVELARADLQRGLDALRPGNYDAPLAVRCLLDTAGNQHLPEWQQLYRILTGTGYGVRG